MSKAVRAAVFFLAVTAAIAAVCAIAGAIFAAFSNRASAPHGIAWAMWIGAR